MRTELENALQQMILLALLQAKDQNFQELLNGVTQRNAYQPSLAGGIYYMKLKRLQQAGLISSYKRSQDSRQITYFHIEPAGEACLRQDASDLSAIMQSFLAG